MDKVSDLEFFKTIARIISSRQTLKDAAKELSLTGAAVSIRLAGIEKRLGTVLVNRTTRSLSLTEAGRLYLKRGGEILSEIEELEEELNSSAKAPVGRIRITAPPGFGRAVVAPFVAEFKRKFPDILIDLVFSDKPLDLISGNFDFAIRFGNPKDSNFVARKLMENHQIVCCSPALLPSLPPLKTPENLQKAPSIIILEDDNTVGVWRLEKGGRKEMVRTSPVLCTNDGTVALQWCVDGLGVILRSQWDAGPFIEQGKLVRVLPEWSLRTDIHVLFPSRKGLSERVQIFLSLFQQALDKRFGHKDPPK